MFTDTEQLLPAAIEAPVTPRVPPPAAPPVTAPPQVLLTAGVPVLVIPAGYVSVNCTPVSAVLPLGLKIVIVRRETSPGPTVFGANGLGMPATREGAVFDAEPTEAL